jgi:hypothetical protein
MQNKNTATIAMMNLKMLPFALLSGTNITVDQKSEGKTFPQVYEVSVSPPVSKVFMHTLMFVAHGWIPILRTHHELGEVDANGMFADGTITITG